MYERDWPDSLVNLASTLRPYLDGRRARLLEIATHEGLIVRLKGVMGHFRRSGGKIRLIRTPVITVYRPSHVKFQLDLGPTDEHLLTSVERFTLAHEIGHWLAFDRWGIQPEARRNQYWRDEAIVNRFAASLLVPDWQVQNWVGSQPAGQDLHVQRLFEWARECAVSAEVVSTRLCEFCTNIGFLKFWVFHEKGRPFLSLRVRHSACAGEVFLPNKHKAVHNERLLSTLQSHRGGVRYLPGLSFDERLIQDLYCSWVFCNYRNTSLYSSKDKISDDSRPQKTAEYWTAWGKKGFPEKPSERNLV